MNLKERPGDFRVHERLRPGYLCGSGEHRVYRVRKRKLTSFEAAAELAREVGVAPADVGLAGLKDRQGITVQYMSVAKGRAVRIDEPTLSVEPAGFARTALSSEESLGNDFTITVRGLARGSALQLTRQAPIVATHGLVNYFDEQRFGNLEHGQGWIARDLLEGRVEQALRRLLTSASRSTPERMRRLRLALRKNWGDWRSCREIAGKLGEHHSVFEHLGRQPDDFVGAFGRVARRVRLIHLYAFQSHLWNRAAVGYLRWSARKRRLLSVQGPEGPFIFYAERPPEGWTPETVFPLAGTALEGVTDRAQRESYLHVLEREGLKAEDLRIEGISGFQLKAESRPLVVYPKQLRASELTPDVLHRGRFAVELSFSMGRGAYASLVVKRLLARAGRSIHGRSEQGGYQRGQSQRGPSEGGANLRGPNTRGAGYQRGGYQGAGQRGYGSQGPGPQGRGSQGRDRAGDDRAGHDRRDYGQHGSGRQESGRQGYGRQGHGHPGRGPREAGPGGPGNRSHSQPSGNGRWARDEGGRAGYPAGPPSAGGRGRGRFEAANPNPESTWKRARKNTAQHRRGRGSSASSAAPDSTTSKD